MTFLERLQTHKGALLHISPQLFWYNGRGWDKNPGRICLILDVTAPTAVAAAAATTVSTTAATAAGVPTATTLLLIDGSLQWVRVAEQDIDLLVNDPPAN
jgi:hypothetical protein